MANVLIIDDEPEACEAVAGFLARSGHTVLCVSSGREALTAIAEMVPDAIFLDLLMPGMDGLALLQVLKSYLRWRTVPVAILTAYPEDPRLWRLAEHGVARVFTKSKVNLDELLAWVNDSVRPPPTGDGPTSRLGV